MPVKTLTIDGQLVSANADQTILEAAREAGIFIPALCRLEGVSTIGACRICLVEMAGTNRWSRPASPRWPKAWRSGRTPTGSATTGE